MQTLLKRLLKLIPFSIYLRYWKNIYYDAEQGPNCCSDTAISFHYVPPMQMYVYEYMIYSVGFRIGQSSQKEENENLLEDNSEMGNDEPK